ncbi:MAG: rod shape-determining protein RodA [Pseudomonadales bacterium]|jgi:rod shape determining protein RodA|nr:rod shape-determining protein RodA [Pseudomonadales bacterium]MDP4639873.1 rod shape-determining protein RodA [Pseudomonadales bacterium]MDP4765116.1 rod shape-determining protein RodA [Pseudomonadales bacterium]MDP4874799.1 rod shape-determining protein RodA [Pseudomonadales bacterium]MDP4910565.1 rod shape-determining protein RodA [Pseudomonadales bacterium]
MSQDFVRRMPYGSSSLQRKSMIGEKLHLDVALILLLVLICSFGLVVLYSAVGRETAPLMSQLVKIGMATLAMLVMAQIAPVFYLRTAPWLYLLGLVMLVLVLFFGYEVNGSARWLRVPGVFTFQPAEIMKLMVPMILAWYFHDRHLPPRPKHLFWACVMIAIPVVLIGVQPDLGTALLIGAAGLLVILLAGISWRYVFAALGLGLMSLPALWFVMRDYQRQRVLTLLNPESDPLGSGWNIIQSKTAIGSGGLFGKGIFQGTQSHLDFLPESQTDFIIAVLAEEWGLIGVVVLLTLYTLLTARGVVMAAQAQDTFGRLLTGSITFTFFVYVFVNIGMVSGILPVVGVPLPLVSYGGTSILTLFAGFGIMMSIHTHRRITL